MTRRRKYPWVGEFNSPPPNERCHVKVFFIGHSCGYVLEADEIHQERLDGTLYKDWREESFKES